MASNEHAYIPLTCFNGHSHRLSSVGEVFHCIFPQGAWMPLVDSGLSGVCCCCGRRKEASLVSAAGL